MTSIKSRTSGKTAKMPSSMLWTSTYFRISVAIVCGTSLPCRFNPSWQPFLTRAILSSQRFWLRWEAFLRRRRKMAWLQNLQSAACWSQVEKGPPKKSHWLRRKVTCSSSGSKMSGPIHFSWLHSKPECVEARSSVCNGAILILRAEWSVFAITPYWAATKQLSVNFWKPKLADGIFLCQMRSKHGYASKETAVPQNLFCLWKTKKWWRCPPSVVCGSSLSASCRKPI